MCFLFAGHVHLNVLGFFPRKYLVPFYRTIGLITNQKSGSGRETGWWAESHPDSFTLLINVPTVVPYIVADNQVTSHRECVNSLSKDA